MTLASLALLSFHFQWFISIFYIITFKYRFHAINICRSEVLYSTLYYYRLADTHLSSWVHISAVGYTSQQLDTHLSSWIHITAVGYTSQQLGTHLSSWVHTSAVGYTSQQLGTMSP